MSIWTDLQADVYTWTNRPDLVAETTLALRNALRTAHRQGKFWRDLTVVDSPTLPMEQVQSFTLSTTCPRIRQISYIKTPEDSTTGYGGIELTEADPRMLLDLDGYSQVDVYWALGDTLYMRARNPVEVYKVGYYLQPQMYDDPGAPLTKDWLLTDYWDVPVLLAASTVLAAIGETEIKGRVDQLVSLAISNMVADQTEVTGR